MSPLPPGESKDLAVAGVRVRARLVIELVLIHGFFHIAIDLKHDPTERPVIDPQCNHCRNSLQHPRAKPALFRAPLALYAISNRLCHQVLFLPFFEFQPQRTHPNPQGLGRARAIALILGQRLQNLAAFQFFQRAG